MTYKILCNLLPVDVVNKILDYKEYNIYDTTKFHMYKFLNVLKISKLGKYVDPIFDFQHEYIIQRINEIKRYTYMYLYSDYDCYGIDLIDYYMIKKQEIINVFPKINMRLYIQERIVRCNNCDNTTDYCPECCFIIS